MVKYLSSDEKHMYGIPYITFKLYNNMVVPSWVDLDPCPKRGVMKLYFNIPKKVSTI
jgi:hypothetical protein